MPDSFRKRKSIRIDNYDYKSLGMYFITICINNKENLLGSIEGGNFKPHPNNPHQIMIDSLFELEEYYPNIKISEYIIMPNHIHFIIGITEKTEKSISDIIRSYKLHTTKLYIDGVKAGVFERFNKKLWQKGFYERVIRDDRDLYETQKYIIENPYRWEVEKFYRK